MKSVLIAILKTVVTALLFYLLFRKVDFPEFAATLKHARYDVLIFSFCILWIGHSMWRFPLAHAHAAAYARGFGGETAGNLLHRTLFQSHVSHRGAVAT